MRTLEHAAPVAVKAVSVEDRMRAHILQMLRITPAGVTKSDLLDTLVGNTSVKRKTIAEMKLSGLIAECRQSGRSHIFYVLGH